MSESSHRVRRHASYWLAALAFLGIAAGQAPMTSGEPKRAATVADAIEMTRPGDSTYINDWLNPADLALFSPDGSKFAFVTQKGDLKRDVITYSLWVFETANVLASPRPKLVASLASSSNRPAISEVKWLPDNNTLVFLGVQPGENPQIYKVRSTTGKIERLTNQGTPIIEFSMDDAGDAFAYLAEVKKEPVFSDEARRRGFFVTPGHKWDELYVNRREFDLRHEIYVKTAEMQAPALAGVVQRSTGLSIGDTLNISPNGNYALLRVFNTAPPPIWDDYEIKSYTEVPYDRSVCIAGTVDQCPDQYWLVDLRKKTTRPLINAPNLFKVEGWSLAAWTKDNTVLLVNALLPLDSVSEEERLRRQRDVFVAEVTVTDGEVRTIAERDHVWPAALIEPDVSGDRLITKPELGIADKPLSFQKQNDKWEIREITWSDAQPHAPLTVTLDEDINSPPKLMATDPKTKKKTVSMDLNPQFANLTFGRVEVFRWKNREERPAGGELYYPVGYVAVKRYPLVVQTHGESRERFWIDGPFTTANAAQALANRGFFVLQIGEGDRYNKAALDEVAKAENTAQEGPFNSSFAESAIDELDHRGLIDPNRVGITGFSRTVFQSEYLLTHSSYRFGAAVIADGVDFGPIDCLFYFVPGYTSACEQINGGLPWGDSLANWAKAAPTMRLDKIHTPILLQSISAPLGEWEVYAGLQWLKKPVDLVNFYPEGEHILVRPQQKYLSEQSAVDWYCFWLKGEEDADPAKAEQYERWRELRKLQDTNTAEKKRN